LNIFKPAIFLHVRTAANTAAWLQLFVSTFNGEKGFNYAKGQTGQSGSPGHRAGWQEHGLRLRPGGNALDDFIK
jgi:hypothetical protein